MTKNTKVLSGIVAVAIVFAAIGFFIMGQRIKNPAPATQQSNDNSADQTQTSQTDSQVTQLAQIPSDWKTYVNDKHGFSLQYPPNLKAGAVSSNSVLGTFQVPIRGLHVGPLVIIALEDKDVKKTAQDYFDGVYKEAQNPGPVTPGEPTVSCTVDNITNTKVVSIRSVTCNGEGGAAKYAYISGKTYDVFIDGYSKGYDDADNGNFQANTDYAQILSTFTFTKDTVSTNTTSPTPPTTTPSPNPSTTPPAATPPPASKIQNFSITADDSAATPAEVTVPAGTIVELTFNVAATNVYYGGLDFRSSVVNSGTIHSGESKTISFTAKNSFEFTPYWPASQVAKAYKIKVTVN